MKFSELLNTVNSRLQDLGLEHSEDGRVQGLFSDRTARYFRQAGVLSPPEGQGSGAIWSDIHVLQLVATRVLQAQGNGVQDVISLLNGKNAKQIEDIIKNFNRQCLPAEKENSIHATLAWDLGSGFQIISSQNKPIPQKKLQAIKRILENHN
tara:strand:- start:1017 stop:1472 length:456 start_codon:yes stop_codon:yes gene_type:complete